MNLYRVAYREWNSSFSDMYDCEELSVGKNEEEAIERVKEIAGKDARDFEAVKVSNVFGYKVIFNDGNTQNIEEEPCEKIQSKSVNDSQIVAAVDSEDNSIDIAVMVDDEPLVTLNVSVNEDTITIRKWIGSGDSMDEQINIDDIYDQEQENEISMQ